MSSIAMFIVTSSVVICEQFLLEVTARRKELTTIKNTIILFVCPSKILHKHCSYLVLGPLQVPKETGNNRPIRLTKCCTQFRSFGNKTFCSKYFHMNATLCKCNIYTKNLKNLNWVQHCVRRIGLCLCKILEAQTKCIIVFLIVANLVAPSPFSVNSEMRTVIISLDW